MSVRAHTVFIVTKQPVDHTYIPRKPRAAFSLTLETDRRNRMSVCAEQKGTPDIINIDRQIQMKLFQHFTPAQTLHKKQR